MLTHAPWSKQRSASPAGVECTKTASGGWVDWYVPFAEVVVPHQSSQTGEVSRGLADQFAKEAKSACTYLDVWRGLILSVVKGKVVLYREMKLGSLRKQRWQSRRVSQGGELRGLICLLVCVRERVLCDDRRGSADCVSSMGVPARQERGSIRSMVLVLASC